MQNNFPNFPICSFLVNHFQSYKEIVSNLYVFNLFPLRFALRFRIFSAILRLWTIFLPIQLFLPSVILRFVTVSTLCLAPFIASADLNIVSLDIEPYWILFKSPRNSLCTCLHCNIDHTFSHNDKVQAAKGIRRWQHSEEHVLAVWNYMQKLEWIWFDVEYKWFLVIISLTYSDHIIIKKWGYFILLEFIFIHN